MEIKIKPLEIEKPKYESYYETIYSDGSRHLSVPLCFLVDENKKPVTIIEEYANWLDDPEFDYWKGLYQHEYFACSGNYNDVWYETLSLDGDSETTICDLSIIDYNAPFNVLEIANFQSNGSISTGTLLLHSGKATEKIGTISAEKFSEPVNQVKIQSKFGNIDRVIERAHCWAAMIEAAYKIEGIRFESVIFGNSIVPFFAMSHKHLSYLMTDKEVEALSHV